MTSTNMFQGLDEGSKPSSRVLRPPGGGSSNIFGGYEDAGASRRPNKMASNIFAPAEAPRGGSTRSNPPGGKSSGIFAEPVAPSQPKIVPPGGASSNIFGGPETNPPAVKSHPNKPKDNIGLGAAVTPEPPAPRPKEPEPVKEMVKVPPATPTKEAAPAEPTPTQDAEASLSEKDHEPRLGARPRSHNRVLNPPGGKSSVVFY
ncbi:jupiter microtubule associated homolog 2 [Trichomycterus rosablanca]|uniref:jupiter microtubule associated homolog 2 n=1 Tax=Trichomycterus rosablanca TaxID=2290929 RepID=UPI002F35DCC9